MLSTTTEFDNHVKGSTRKPRHQVNVAWERTKNASLTFAVVGTSTVDGDDIVQGEFTEITEPDLFAYTDESDYVLDIEVSRRMNEPQGGLFYGLGKLSLENTTQRFSFNNTSSPIDEYILPNRPIKLFLGFELESITTLLPALYGLTQTPVESKSNANVSFNIIDYVSYINDYPLQSTMYVGQRSDQIIADILGDIGFTSGQYTLSSGLNTIDFAWFPKGTKAGDAIKEITQAEGGVFYQNELGDLVFQTSRDLLDNTSSVWTVRAEDVVNWENDNTTQIINRCTIKAKPRAVTDNNVEIWRLDNYIELQPAEVKEVWAAYEDPIFSYATLTATTDYLANSSSDGSGTNFTSSVAISATNFTQDTKFTITNNSGAIAYITYLRQRGKPAVVTAEIEEIYEDTTSQGIYGVKELTIENDYIDTDSFAYYMARDIVRRFAYPKNRIVVEIPLTPQLQLKDVVTLTDPVLNVTQDFRIVEIRHKYGASITELTCRALTGLEALSPAIVGTSTVGGDDVVWI